MKQLSPEEIDVLREEIGELLLIGYANELSQIARQAIDAYEALQAEHDKLVRALTRMAFGDEDWSPTYAEADAAEEIAEEAGIVLDHRVLRA